MLEYDSKKEIFDNITKEVRVAKANYRWRGAY